MAGCHQPRQGKRRDWHLSPGDIIRRPELHRIYGASGQSGISPSRTSLNFIIFTDRSAGDQHGYHDRWQGTTRRTPPSPHHGALAHTPPPIPNLSPFRIRQPFHHQPPLEAPILSISDATTPCHGPEYDMLAPSTATVPPLPPEKSAKQLAMPSAV